MWPYLFRNGRVLKGMKGFIKRAGILVDIHNHGCLALAAEETLEQACHLALSEGYNLKLIPENEFIDLGIINLGLS